MSSLFLYLRSNIPSKTFYSEYESEILRTARRTSSKLIFSNSARKLTTRMCKQGERIKKFSDTLLGRHFMYMKTFSKISKILPYFFRFRAVMKSDSCTLRWYFETS